MKEKDNFNFDEAYLALQKIIEEIEDENIGLETLAAKVKSANELLVTCENKLREITNTLNNEV